MRRRDLLRSGLVSALAGSAPTFGQAQVGTTAGLSARATWVKHLDRVARPVLEALAAGRLRATMPIEAHPEMAESRKRTAHLEAFGRLLSGMAPWLELAPASDREGELRRKYVSLAQQALGSALDPRSPDALLWNAENQNLVDAAFLALAVLRAPRVLNLELEAVVRARLIAALMETRVLEANYNNWLLFAACVEAAIARLGGPWDAMRVDYALREHMRWYLGDGTYGDGPELHWDYYNSFVIHPFLLAVLHAVGDHRAAWKPLLPQVRARAARYAEVQERMIAADGTYPVVGRSIAYRCGAFHALADVALRRMLPENVAPEQVRCAMAAMIARTLTPDGTFDNHGWLRIGLAGHQPSLGEPYISTGSLYLCANAFLPLGLGPEDRFWNGPNAPWTAQKVWAGVDMPADHALGGPDMAPAAGRH